MEQRIHLYWINHRSDVETSLIDQFHLEIVVLGNLDFCVHSGNFLQCNQHLCNKKLISGSFLKLLDLLLNLLNGSRFSSSADNPKCSASALKTTSGISNKFFGRKSCRPKFSLNSSSLLNIYNQWIMKLVTGKIENYKKMFVRSFENEF